MGSIFDDTIALAVGQQDTSLRGRRLKMGDKKQKAKASDVQERHIGGLAMQSAISYLGILNCTMPFYEALASHGCKCSRSSSSNTRPLGLRW